MTQRVDAQRERAASREKPLDSFNGTPLPPGATHIRLLGMDYIHVRTRDEGDLYVTRFGVPYLEHLQLKNWREDTWFEARRQKLKGTSTVYRVPTKAVHGRHVDLVVKWCRVGEEVPLDTLTFDKFAEAEFNSPYEEFSLLMEMRAQSDGAAIRTNHPLAIYVPPEKLQLWQTGRSKHRMNRKKAKYRDVELDIFRQYVLIYEWVKGVSADEALESIIPDEKRRDVELRRLTERARLDMKENGFMVIDHKPAHVILRPRPDGSILRDHTGDYAYALVDFELLQRTPDHERKVEMARRTEYLRHQQKRFAIPKDHRLPEHLRLTSVFGVDYVWGRAESTHGMLFVVGRDPELFDYFLPERWRHTSRRRLSKTNETFYTRTKDHINLVWKVSRVGETPAIPRHYPHAREIIAHGYNSPFEEFAIALELARKGFSTVYPRAIYRAGREAERAPEYTLDNSRFESHRDLLTPDGKKLLSPEHNYLTIWGFWKGIDERSGSPDEPGCVGINIPQALKERRISRSEKEETLARMRRRLEEAGFEADLRPTHYLLSVKRDGTLRREDDGSLYVTLCNFELLRRREAAS